MPRAADDAPARPSSLLAYPTYLCTQVSKVAQRRLTDALAEHDLKPSHFAVLAAVAERGALTQQQLADGLDLDKSHLVAFIDHLEGRRLVARQRDTEDRRCQRVAATADGTRLLGELHAIDERCQDDVFGALTVSERRQLTALLERVVRDHDERRRTPAPAAAGSAG